MNKEKDILCEVHKIETNPNFLCWRYSPKPNIDIMHTPADDMKCDTCIYCHKKGE